MQHLIVIVLNACKRAAVFIPSSRMRIVAARRLERSNAESTPQPVVSWCVCRQYLLSAHSFPHGFQLLAFRELTGISSYQKALHPCCAAPLQNPHYKHQARKRHWSRNSHHTFTHLIPERKKNVIFSSNLVKSLAADHTNMMEPQWGQRKQLRRQLIRSQPSSHKCSSRHI